MCNRTAAVARGLGVACLGFALGFAVVIVTSEREVSITSDLLTGSTFRHDLAAPLASAAVADLSTSASSNRMLYDPVPAEVVFKNLPGKYVRSQIEYSYGELMSFGSNRTYNRRLIDFTAPGSREFLFAPSKLPIIFLINLDHRTDRL